MCPAGVPLGSLRALRRYIDAIPTGAPTILLANGDRRVVQPVGPLDMGLSYSSSCVTFRCLGNGLHGWTRGRRVSERVPPCAGAARAC